jgi:NADH-quinone oxidoreductase subunit I
LCEDVCPTKPDKAIKLSGGTFHMMADGIHDTIQNDFWITSGVTDEWIDQKQKDEEEKARKKAEAKAEAAAKAAQEPAPEAPAPKEKEEEA